MYLYVKYFWDVVSVHAARSLQRYLSVPGLPVWGRSCRQPPERALSAPSTCAHRRRTHSTDACVIAARATCAYCGKNRRAGRRSSCIICLLRRHAAAPSAQSMCPAKREWPVLQCLSTSCWMNIVTTSGRFPDAAPSPTQSSHFSCPDRTHVFSH